MLYQDINTIAQRLNGEFCAAEAQGMAAGMLCINDGALAQYWLQEILQNADSISNRDASLLEMLFEETRKQLRADDFSFELLLPDEQQPLDEQVDALTSWCQGFLYGLGTGAGITQQWPEDVREIVKDIAECTKLEADEEDEEAENDFVEITEYLRSAVVFLRSELCVYNGDTLH